MNPEPAPLIVHVIYRLAIGGLENGLVNLINHMPRDQYRHAIICLTDFTDFKDRIERDDVDVYALHKKQGKDIGVYFKLWRLIRQLKPSIIHSRNISTIDMVLPSFLACRAKRIHGEHGRDIFDLYGKHARYQSLRRWLKPLIHRFITLSKDLDQWLVGEVGIPRAKVTQLYNGVNSRYFHPGEATVAFPGSEGKVIFGTVGRLADVKDQLNLVKAVNHLVVNHPDIANRLVVMLIGDGERRTTIEDYIKQHELEKYVYVMGARNDTQAIYRSLQCFVLPSLGEGISNTILEAMSSGLPVLATDVGGNPELVVQDQTGMLVPSANPEAMAKSISVYVKTPELLKRHGNNGRKRVEDCFSMEKMVLAYTQVYDELLNRK